VAKFSRDELIWSVAPKSKIQRTNFGSDLRLQVIPMDVLGMWWCSVLGVAANWDCWRRVRRELYCFLVKLKLDNCWDSFWFVSVSLSFAFLIAMALLTKNFLLF